MNPNHKRSGARMTVNENGHMTQLPSEGADRQLLMQRPALIFHRNRTMTAAQHVAEEQGMTTEEVLAEWVIERESLFSHICEVAVPIIGRLGHDDSAVGPWAKYSVPGIQRRWVVKLKELLERGKKISDFRVLVDNPLPLSLSEREELDRSRVVIAAIHQWMHVGANESMSLTKAESAMVHAMQEYDAHVMQPDFSLARKDGT